MKWGILSRIGDKVKWGGDTKMLTSLQTGLRKLGHTADFVEDPSNLGSYDLALLSSTCLDQRPVYHALRLSGAPYALLSFHEDMIRYCGAASGFFRYVRGILDGREDEGHLFSLQRLIENPHLLYYYAEPVRKMAMANYDVINNAAVCFANTQREAAILKRDCPSCRTFVAPLPPGFAEGACTPGDEFLPVLGLASGEYILQIGRMEPRKNQLATILATKDLPMPLVFISTLTVNFEYEKTCLEAIYKYRKAPTFILSQTLPTMKAGPLHILQMPRQRKITRAHLLSALFHAGLHLHPAFYELPGLTYLEAAKLGTPSIASSWATISDYFQSHPLDNRIVYTEPFDLSRITALVQEKFGQRYPRIRHPAFDRTSLDFAKDYLSAILEPAWT